MNFSYLLLDLILNNFQFALIHKAFAFANFCKISWKWCMWCAYLTHVANKHVNQKYFIKTFRAYIGNIQALLLFNLSVLFLFYSSEISFLIENADRRIHIRISRILEKMMYPQIQRTNSCLSRKGCGKCIAHKIDSVEVRSLNRWKKLP